MIHLILALLIPAASFAGDVLFIDLNNSTNEVRACANGIAEGSRPGFFQKGDQLRLAGSNLLSNQHKKLTPAVLDDYLSQLDQQGVSIDTIVISGHDGSGHYFGENSDAILSSDLRKLTAKHPSLSNSLTNMALWGCYGTNDNACENFWMRRISPNIKSTIGFTVQSPDNKQPRNWSMLQDYCLKRNQISNAENSQEVTDLLRGLDNGRAVNTWNVGICYKNGVCSFDYDKVGEKRQNCFHTYEELHERCKEFDPDSKLLDTFEEYMAASDDEHKEPPPDGDDEYTVNERSSANAGKLRSYYNQLQDWRHCAEEFASDRPGYEMPLPAQVIRLVKFQTLKTNFGRIESRQISEYNHLLHSVGLDKDELDTSKDRRDIVNATQGAVSDIEAMMKGGEPRAQYLPTAIKKPKLQNIGFVATSEDTPQTASSGTATVSNVDLRKLLVMARGFDRSLRELDYRCTHFTLVHEGATETSPCVKSYEEIH